MKVYEKIRSYGIDVDVNLGGNSGYYESSNGWASFYWIKYDSGKIAISEYVSDKKYIRLCKAINCSIKKYNKLYK